MSRLATDRRIRRRLRRRRTWNAGFDQSVLTLWERRDNGFMVIQDWWIPMASLRSGA